MGKISETPAINGSRSLTAPVVLLAVVAIFAQIGLADTGEPLEKLLFEYRVKDAELQKPIEELIGIYQKQLEKLSETAQSAGDLDFVVMIKKEVDALKGGEYTPAQGNSAELKRIQRIFDVEKRKREKVLQDQRRQSLASFVADIDELKVEFTKGGEVDKALALDVAIKRAKRLDSVKKIPKPDDWLGRGWSNIPKDAVEYNLHYYCCFDEQFDWKTAKEKCEKLGGTLVCIETNGEMKFIAKLIGDRQRIWVGGLSDSNGQNWKWVNGKNMNFQNWRSRRPDNSGGENFVVLYGGGAWEDFPANGAVNSFICEWE